MAEETPAARNDEAPYLILEADDARGLVLRRVSKVQAVSAETARRKYGAPAGTFLVAVSARNFRLAKVGEKEVKPTTVIEEIEWPAIEATEVHPDQEAMPLP